MNLPYTQLFLWAGEWLLLNTVTATDTSNINPVKQRLYPLL